MQPAITGTAHFCPMLSSATPGVEMTSRERRRSWWGRGHNSSTRLDLTLAGRRWTQGSKPPVPPALKCDDIRLLAIETLGKWTNQRQAVDPDATWPRESLPLSAPALTPSRCKSATPGGPLAPTGPHSRATPIAGPSSGRIRRSAYEWLQETKPVALRGLLLRWGCLETTNHAALS